MKANNSLKLCFENCKTLQMINTSMTDSRKSFIIKFNVISKLILTKIITDSIVRTCLSHPILEAIFQLLFLSNYKIYFFNKFSRNSHFTQSLKLMNFPYFWYIFLFCFFFHTSWIQTGFMAVIFRGKIFTVLRRKRRFQRGARSKI